MPAVIHNTMPAPRRLRINMYSFGGGYEVELLDLDRPIEEQRARLSDHFKERATRIFTTDVTVGEVVPYVTEIDGTGDTVPPVDHETHKP